MKFKSWIKYLVFLILMISLGLLYEFSSHRNGVRKITNPIIEFQAGENNFLTHQMVNKLLIQNEDSLQNKAKSLIDLYVLENTIVNNPYVEKASVFLTVNGVLKTIVKQRSPIARFINKDDSYYVDRDGVIVPLSKSYSARVLLVFGVENKDEIKKIMPLLRYINRDNFLQKEVVGIQKNDRNEYQFSVRSGDYKIDFGKNSNIDIKFKKLKAFYNKTFEDKTIQNYKTINIKYHNQVVCAK